MKKVTLFFKFDRSKPTCLIKNMTIPKIKRS
jgi:hypothetical protein